MNIKSTGWRVFRIIRTFLIVSIGRAFPRAASAGVAFSMMGSLFAVTSVEPFRATVSSFGLGMGDYVVIALACIVWFIVSFIAEREENRAKAAHADKKKGIVSGRAQGEGDAETGAEVRNLIDKLSLPVRWALYLGLFLAVLLLGVYGPGYSASTFIYRGF